MVNDKGGRSEYTGLHGRAGAFVEQNLVVRLRGAANKGITIKADLVCQLRYNLGRADVLAFVPVRREEAMHEGAPLGTVRIREKAHAKWQDAL